MRYDISERTVCTINGLVQAAKRKARGYTRFRTIRIVIFLIARKLDFSKLNPHIHNPVNFQLRLFS
jgi:hypothetical protein